MNAAEFDILALTNDDQLLQAVVGAAHGERRVLQAGDAAAAVEAASGNLVGVLVTDAPVDRLPAIIAQLEQHAPGLVTILAAERDHGGELIALNTGGPVFRFVLKPVSTGQLRLYVDAALKRHLELIARGPQPVAAPAELATPAPRRMPRGLVAGAVAAAILATLCVTLLATRPEEVALGAHAVTPAPDMEPHLLRLVAQARQAERDGRVVEPPGDNALDYYAAVLADDPGHRLASEKLAEIADAMFARAETALANHRLEVARRAVANAKRALPGHPRVAYFNTRLEAEEQQQMLSQALAAAGSGDLQEAAGLIEEAAQVRRGETDAVADARAELARREEVRSRIEGLLGDARARLDAGHLVEPADDSALHYIDAARRAGARPAELAALSTALANEMLAEAVDAIHAERYDDATEWLAQVRDLAPGLEALPAAEIELAAASERAGRIARALVLAHARIDEGRVLDPVDDSAFHYVGLLRADGAPAAQLDPVMDRLFDAVAATVDEAIVARQLDAAGRALAAARALGDTTPGLARAEQAYAAATAAAARAAAEAEEASHRAALAQTDAPRTAPERTSPVRRKYVAPEYPVTAERRQIEGRVELELTIDAAGRVKSVAVTNAQPRDTFDRAAIAAAQQWEYQPAHVDGAPVETRTLVAIDFSLD
jgi:TonB family protein